VKLDSLEARLRSVEQLDKRTPWKAEGRTMQEQLSRSRDWVSIIMDDVNAAHTFEKGDCLAHRKSKSFGRNANRKTHYGSAR
jgi:hypothetical protein